MDIGAGIYFVIITAFFAAAIVAVMILFRFFKPENWLKNVDKALKEKNYVSAVSQILEYLKKRQSSFILYKYLGEAYEGLGQFHRSIENYEKAFVKIERNYSEAIKIEILLKLGNLYHLIKRNEEALGYFKMVLKDHSKSSTALWNISEILFEAGKYNMCRDILAKYIYVKPGDNRAILLLSKVYYHAGEFQNSINMIQRITAASQNYSVNQLNEISLLHAYNNFSLKRYNDAINLLKPFLKERIVSGEVLNRIVISMIKLGQNDKAIQALDDNLLRLAPNERCKTLYEIGNVLFNENDIVNALDIWDNAYTINPKFLDLADIKRKYRVLYNNPNLKCYYISSDEMFRNYISKRMKAETAGNLVEINKDYLVINGSSVCSVLYRQPNEISADRLDELDDLLKARGVNRASIDIYSLFGVDDEAKRSLFYNKIKEISGDDFIKIFGENTIQKEAVAG